MPSRLIPFRNQQIYHLYNRGTAKQRIFYSRRDYARFLRSIAYYRFTGPKPSFSKFTMNQNLQNSQMIVEILTYCLMPNHFHLLVKQLRENGITEFMSKLSNSYTKYFNTKHHRVGPLLQGEFKSVLIEDDEQLAHVSRYIHLNPVVASLVNDPTEYEWSSLNEFLELSVTNITNPLPILSHFSANQSYYQFILDQIDYAKQLENFKHQSID